jgi:hypothetical protein
MLLGFWNFILQTFWLREGAAAEAPGWQENAGLAIIAEV